MTVDFYDGLADLFHLVHGNWEKSIARQAGELDGVIRELCGDRVRRVLDAACGIGTQALGLAGLGYEVTGSDLSPGSIGRARVEAKSRGLEIELSVADLRRLFAHHGRAFDLVIACDNAIPHLLSDEEILAAFREMYLCTEPGGGCIISVRDYAAMELGGTRIVPFGVRHDGATKYVVFQLWEFEGPIYDLHMFFVEDGGEPVCRVRVVRSKYYAVSIARLCELMTEAGYTGVRRLDGRFFQPLVVGLRPGRHA
jgi:SAM-dependent methyltransferase